VSSRTLRALAIALSVTLTIVVAGAAAQDRPSFEAASIRPSPDELPTTPAGVQFTPHQFRASYLSLKDYIGIAYRLPPHQVSAPEWIASQRFEIVATFPDGTPPERFLSMLQSLLVERFELQAHRESREAPVYALEVAADRFKLSAVPDDPEEKRPYTVASTGGPNGIAAELGGGATLSFANGRFDARKVTLAQFSETLTRFLDRPILNLTGLEKRYDIGFEVTPEDYVPMLIRSAVNGGIPMPPQALSRLDGASIVSVQDGLKALGLSLTARRAPLETLIVDSMRRTPTEN